MPAQLPSFGKLSTEDPEVKPVNTFVTVITDPAPVVNVSKLLQHFSDWYRLKKTVVIFWRVKTILKERRLKSFKDQQGSLITTNDKAERRLLITTVEELEEAEHAIICLTQFQSFGNVLKSLYQACRNKHGYNRTPPQKGNELTKTSSL